MVRAVGVRTSPLDLPGPNGIAVQRSTDAGVTWSEPQWLRAPRSSENWGCGDPSLITLADGTLLCWYVSSTDTSFWDDQRPGEGWDVWLARSTDRGSTWTHTPLLEEQPIWPEKAGCLFASSGNGIQLGSGRILQPLVMRGRGTQERWVQLAISDDDGASWRLGAPVPGCDESKVAELPDGTVVLHARATPHRLTATSYDGGETFSDPMPDLPDPGCNGGLTALTDGRLAFTLVYPDGVDASAQRENEDSAAEQDASPSGAARATAAMPDPARASARATAAMPDPTGGRGAASGPVWDARRNLVLRTGRTGAWSEPVTIDAGHAAYSVIVTLPDERVAIAWERGAYEGISVTVLEAP